MDARRALGAAGAACIVLSCCSLVSVLTCLVARAALGGGAAPEPLAKALAPAPAPAPKAPAPRLELTRTSGGEPVSVDLSWPTAFDNGQFFIVIETVQQAAAGGSAFGVRTVTHAVRTYAGGVSIYGSSPAVVVGDPNIAGTLAVEAQQTGRSSLRITSKVGWNFNGNPGKHHSLTVRILQAPDTGFTAGATLA